MKVTSLRFSMSLTLCLSCTDSNPIGCPGRMAAQSGCDGVPVIRCRRRVMQAMCELDGPFGPCLPTLGGSSVACLSRESVMITSIIVLAVLIALIRWGGRWLSKHYGDMV